MKTRVIVSYLLLFVFSVAVFLVVLFPGQQIASYISQSLTNPKKNIYTVMGSIYPSLPFSLKSEDTRISIGRKLNIKPDFIKFRLNPGLLFSDHKNIHFTTQIFNGFAKGNVGFEDKKPVVYTNAQLNFSGFEFENIKYDTRMAHITISGIIDGDYQYAIKTENTSDPGTGSFTVKDFSAVLKKSLLNRLKIPKIDFSTIKAQFTQDQRNLNLTQLTATGSVINLKMNGIIQIKNPISRSRLSLTGTVLPDSPYLANFVNSPAIKALVKNIKKDGIRFTVKGTFNQPEIKI